MKNKVYRFYSDPGHGWLAVKVKELEKLQLLDKISSCSYINGKTVYLEEDCDASLFIEAKKAINEEIQYKTINQNKTPIRTYDNYSVKDVWRII